MYLRSGIFLGVTAAAITGTAVACFLALKVPKHPVIHIDRPMVDLGRIKPRQEVNVKVRIENNGGSTLTLGEPTASCGCQRPELAERTLGPGKGTDLKIRQESSEQIGAFQHVIFLTSNDPQVPEARVYLRGVVTRGIDVRPEPLVFESLGPGEQVTRVLEVASDESRPFSITFLNTSGPIRARQTNHAVSVLHKIEVTALGGCLLGPFRGEVIINLDLPESTTLLVPVFGTVEGAIRIHPSRISLGNVTGNSRKAISIHLSSSNVPFKIVDLQAPPGGWGSSYEVVNHGAGASEYSLRVSLKIPNIPGEIDTSLILSIERFDGRKEELLIPLGGLILSEIP